VDVKTGKWTAVDFGIGGGVDSYFEYLVKGGIMFNIPELIDMFHGWYNKLVYSGNIMFLYPRSTGGGILFYLCPSFHLSVLPSVPRYFSSHFSQFFLFISLQFLEHHSKECRLKQLLNTVKSLVIVGF